MLIVTLKDNSQHVVSDDNTKYVIFGENNWFKADDDVYFRSSDVIYVKYKR